MKKNRRQWGLFFVGVCFTCFGFSQASWAEESGFTAEILRPENQLGETESYFDLLVKPNTKHELQVRIKSELDQPQDLDLSITNAQTSNFGEIDYTETKVEEPFLPRVPLTSIAKVQKQVSLKAKEEKVVAIQLTLPKASFDGVILGGLYVQQKPLETSVSGEGMQVKTVFSRAIAIQLREKDQAVAPKIELDQVKGTATDDQYVFTSRIINTKPLLMANVTIETKVYPKDHPDQVLLSETQKQIKIAPESTFDDLLYSDNAQFKPGNYQLEMTVSYQEEKWTFTKAFKVTSRADSDKGRSEWQLGQTSETAQFVGKFLLGLIVILILGSSVLYWRSPDFSAYVRKKVMGKQKAAGKKQRRQTKKK